MPSTDPAPDFPLAVTTEDPRVTARQLWCAATEYSRHDTDHVSRSTFMTLVSRACGALQALAPVQP